MNRGIGFMSFMKALNPCIAYKIISPKEAGFLCDAYKKGNISAIVGFLRCLDGTDSNELLVALKKNIYKVIRTDDEQ